VDVDTVWRHVDEQRAVVADLLESLDDEQLETASLCSAWRVRDVGAHLTLAHMGPATAAVEMVRARGSFDRMIRDTAVRRAREPVAEHAAALRSMIGSRRTAPGVSHLEPLTDVLVHAQDIAVPLGLDVETPQDAAAASADRVWRMGFPFWARRRLRGTRLQATDHDWAVGEGTVREGTMREHLLLLTGRPVG
jgi:uncharacterized protein (TIGR03083 family)